SSRKYVPCSSTRPNGTPTGRRRRRSWWGRASRSTRCSPAVRLSRRLLKSPRRGADTCRCPSRRSGRGSRSRRASASATAVDAGRGQGDLGATQPGVAPSRGRRSGPGEIEEPTGVRGEAVHHVVHGKALELRQFFGDAAGQPRPRGKVLELSPVRPWPVALYQERVERDRVDHLAITVAVHELRRHRDEIAGVDDGPRDLRGRLVPVEERTLHA